MAQRGTIRRSRVAGIALAGLATLIAGAFAALSFGDPTVDSLSISQQSDETTTLVTTSLAPTTMAPTTAAPTTLPPTTTTTKAWPSGPVPTLPATGKAPVISTIATTDPVVFLTIDDGMIRDPRIPELLATYNVPVTLFVNEGPYLANPAYFASLIASGGSINSHTRSHELLTKLSPAAQRAEICGMKDIIARHVFVAGHLFRAPFGVSNAATQTAAGSCGINAVLSWSAALNDGRVQYQLGNQLRPGDIILTHFRDDLYDNIRALLWQTRLQGLTIAPIEDYLPLPASG
jgi:peptidoglycan/xylan/chitin deacetylase (PgdA/CDA1 family)